MANLERLKVKYFKQISFIHLVAIIMYHSANNTNGKRRKRYFLPGCQRDCRDKNQTLLDDKFWYQQQFLKAYQKHEKINRNRKFIKNESS